MIEHDRSVKVAVTPSEGGVTATRLGVLLACFHGAKSASKAHRPLSKELSQGARRLRLQGDGLPATAVVHGAKS